MATHRFPFMRIGAGYRLQPTLPLTLRNPQNDLECEAIALIDTGADRSLLPEHIAKSVGHDPYDSGLDRHSVSGIGGAVTVVTLPFDLLVWPAGAQARETKPVLHLSNIELDVQLARSGADKWIMQGHPVILGQDDFLGRYIWTLDYPNAALVLRVP